MTAEPTDNKNREDGTGLSPFGALAATVSALGGTDSKSINGLYGSSRAYFTGTVFTLRPRPTLVLLPDDESAELFADDLSFFLGAASVALYPSTEVLPFDTQTTHPELRSARIALMARLADSDSEPVIVVAAIHALAQRIMPKTQMADSSLKLVVEEEYERNELIERLSALGYRRMSMVEERGEISVRGSIIDIFPPAFEDPLRIEFYGDLIESIRPFEISSQRSQGSLASALILPGRQTSAKSLSGSKVRDKVIDRADDLSLARGVWEPLSTKLRHGIASESIEALLPLFYDSPLSTLFDYLGDGALISIIDSSLVEARIETYADEVEHAAARMEESGKFFVEPDSLYMPPEEMAKRIESQATLKLEPFENAEGTRVETKSNRELTVELKGQRGSGEEEPLRPLADRIESWLHEGRGVTVTAHNRAQSKRTLELLEGYGLTASVRESTESTEAGTLTVAVGTLSSGFSLTSESLVIVAEEEIFGERAKRREPPKKKLEAFLTQLQDLAVGDHIVHAHHGIALHRGLKRLEVDSVESDFLLLEYAGGDKLYLPVSRMDLISRYHAMEGRTATLDKLGGTSWAKATGKVKHAVEQMAVELLKLYAEREVAEGYSFSAADAMFEEFEAGFEYDETPDQARAIKECIDDMVRQRPMDRLVCGDVGYGKTEVAMRAAFKAAQDSKQVAVLVPTTVLATQHYLTFTSRLAPYPVRVEVLSRFRSKKEQNETIARLGRGEVDILIGTHRLLQKDVLFKDLGMIIIDEEHRFGVAQKERLKALRKSVDVLTLTATPIPRTLHMSFASIRDLSIINTPPEDRLAIKTRVMRFDEEMIAEAISREMNRGGQVFFVHNRIQSMPSMLTFLKRILPDARIAAAHGQMKERELEEKMLGFVNGEIDVLLSTAIIESGLDIPSANTIIINRADRFGLAELYQLRGRVGRSSHRAYAYFICPDSAIMSADARKRIEVIEELSDPGSGFKIATYDLEIRGAGELLGTSQSGSIAAVGFEMYTQLLEEAVAELQGKEVEDEVAPEINLKVSQYLPEEYIADTRLRLGLYKRLAGAADDDEVDAITDEMEDRFGELPELVENLIAVMRLKVSLKRLKATELVQKGRKLYLRLAPPASDASVGAGADPRVANRALDLFKEFPKTYAVTPDSRLVMTIEPKESVLVQAKYLLKELLGAC